MQRVFTDNWGNIEYGEAWDAQEFLLKKNLDVKSLWFGKSEEEKDKSVDTTNYFLFCEHPHVYTLGKSGLMENLLLNDNRLKELGVSFYKTNRGGDITYHGPGQVVGYPILDLEKFFTDLGRYMRSLEEVIIRTIGAWGIKGERLQGEPGVWLDVGIKGKERKICAMGVRCSRWVTMHGFALNVNTNMQYFNYIVPCGIVDKGVTSMEQELGHKVDMEEVRSKISGHFEAVFGAEMVRQEIPTLV
ncbi:lipoyl(octanoyl) transferase LipB [Rurimicrobium arvi]|uniref:Octanoyltransferase n=1 Tax=Rurimicrobium arvi TaxID=2049916 RepID=A0ABP8MWI7_9BACT